MLYSCGSRPIPSEQSTNALGIYLDSTKRNKITIRNDSILIISILNPNSLELNECFYAIGSWKLESSEIKFMQLDTLFIDSNNVQIENCDTICDFSEVWLSDINGDSIAMASILTDNGLYYEECTDVLCPFKMYSSDLRPYKYLDIELIGYPKYRLDLNYTANKKYCIRLIPKKEQLLFNDARLTLMNDSIKMIVKEKVLLFIKEE